MPRYPAFPDRRVQSLDGVWDFCFLGEQDPDSLDDVGSITFSDKMAVPMAFDAMPQYAGRRGLVAYRLRFALAPGKFGRLLFAGMGMWMRVFVDGEVRGEFALPYSPLECLIPASERTERELVVLVDNRFDPSRSPLQRNYFDFYAYGGLFRSVTLQEVQHVWVERAFFSNGQIRLRLGSMRAEPPADANLRFWFNQESPHEAKLAIEWKDGVGTAVVPAEFSGRVWSPDTPHLHQLTAEVAVEGIRSSVVERFGLREVTTRGTEILLNGQPIRLRGYNRHDAHPQSGPALSPGQHLADLQLLKQLGCNCVRGSHYTQDQEFLELCDELGFLVWEESLGWQQDEEQLTNPRYLELQLDQTRRMVLASMNHPSVILWGFLNEGESHLESTQAAYTMLFQAVRELDSTRLVTYASNHIFDDKNLHLADVISVNCYPAWYAESEEVRPLEEIEAYLDQLMDSLAERQPDKPVIISEIGAGAIYGFRDPLRAHWSEEYQADLLQRVAELVLPHPKLSGLLLWQMYDMRTYSYSKALFRPRAFNNKGTLDEYRRPKLAFEVVRSLFEADDCVKPGGPC